jgi:hypothetical protein
MNMRRAYSIGMIIAVLIVLSILVQYVQFTPSAVQGTVLQPSPILSSCSRNSTPLFDLAYADLRRDNDVIDQWSAGFHELMATLTTEQLDPTAIEIECKAETMHEFLKPTDAMQQVIDEWEPFTIDPNTSKLSRLDIGYVMLELLRQYECALQERLYVIEGEISEELVYEIFPGQGSNTYVTENSVTTEAQEQRTKIKRELSTTREAVEQTVRIVTSKERTTIVRAEVECLERASLDIRNATGLAAEANSCLPRIWNSKDVLIDLVE